VTGVSRSSFIVQPFIVSGTFQNVFGEVPVHSIIVGNNYFCKVVAGLLQGYLHGSVKN
jgi:hypothetical protein